MASIACFVSAHGFGHATRACSVMSAIQELDPSIRFEIFTQVPAWVFESSLSGNFLIHDQATDIGVVQKSPFEEDLQETLRRLEAFIPFDPHLVDSLAARVKELGCRLVIADIAPLAIAVARAAGLPSILVENFTWEWIYEGYLVREPRFEQAIACLRPIFQSATYHIQTEPVCNYVSGASLLTAPAGRRARTPRSEIRQRLGVPEQARVVLLSLGGIEAALDLSPILAQAGDLFFIIPTANSQPIYATHHVLLPRHSDYYHPDLVSASDVVIGKAGYSTLAEAYLAGVPFGYVSRSLFRETATLAEFITRELRGFEIPETEFYSASWIPALYPLFELASLAPAMLNGAEQIAGFVLDKLGHELSL